MAKGDQISLIDILKRIPPITFQLPALMQGGYYLALTDKRWPLSIGRIIEKTARQHPHRTAILYEDTQLTYAEFNQQANRAADYFLQRGVGKGDTVALFLENRPELLTLLTGLVKIGAAAAMLNTAQRGKVLAHSIQLVKPVDYVVGEELTAGFESARELLQGGARAPLFLRDASGDRGTATGKCPPGYEDLDQGLSAAATDNPIVSEPPLLGDTACYLYTSGTTGLPKAAPCSHMKWIKAYGGFGLVSLNMQPDDVLYVTLPFYHGTALIVCWSSVVAGGAALAMRRKFSASQFWPDVRRYAATGFGYVGELCRYLLNNPVSEQDRQHKVVKMIGNGLRPSIWKPFKQRFGIRQVAEIYASSEGNIGFSNFFNLDNTVGTTASGYALVKHHEGTREPLRNTRGRLIRVKKGQPGLLLARISWMMPFEGYTQKHATESVIVRNAFRRGDAWFNTGDLMRDIGWRHMQFVDRLGDTFRWKGENVSTTEVEAVFDTQDAIVQSVVYGVEIPGVEGRAGMATLVTRASLNLTDLYRQLANALPSYAIPLFLRLKKDLDITGTFKVQKKKLQDAAFDPRIIDDPLFICLPGEKTYIPLTTAVHERIRAGGYRF